MTALRLRGLNRTIPFGKGDGCLVSTASKMFGFVPVRGEGAHQARLLEMRGGEITVYCDDDFPADPRLLEGVFATRRAEVWSGAKIGNRELLDTVQMWLATALPGFCTVMVDPDRDTGVVTPPKNRTFAMGTVDGPNLAYVTTRPATEDGARAAEFGVHAYGPGASALAEEVVSQLRTWARVHRKGLGPRYRVYPAGTPDDYLPAGSRVVDKLHSRITISWPSASSEGQDVPQPPDK